MSTTAFQPVALADIDPDAPGHAADWVWDGLLARGDIGVLTSFWKAGKTTLLAGLFHALDDGRPFLGRATVAGRALIVSEESHVIWAERRRSIPAGGRTGLISRPFPGNPTPADWNDFVAHVEAGRAAAPVDLLVVDTLATFLPGRSESDGSALLALLHPLRRLALGGTAVLLLHHPRKQPAAEGNAARGSGVLLGYVDTSMELTAYGRLTCDANRRRLSVRSRHPDAPSSLVYEWVPLTPEFRVVADGSDARFRETWEAVRRLLADRAGPVSHRELLADWPEAEPTPTKGQLYDWLNRAVAERWAVRVGRGTKRDPYRFALPPKRSVLADLPPLPPL